MADVSITRCNEYEYEAVEKAVFEALDNLKGSSEKIKPGSKVLIKANLLKINKPEDAITTHPFVVESIVRYLQKLGCKPVIGDSPAGPFVKVSLEAIYKATGMTGVAERTGCELNLDTSFEEVSIPNAKMLPSMQIIKAVLDADLVISAAKLKTHGMMTLSAAVKNLYGVVPGLIKAENHFKLNDVMNFAHHLVDLCEYIKPAISIIDGIEGMEGNGPSGGEKRQAGIILASENPYAVDTAACRIIGMDPSSVPVLKAAAARNIFDYKKENINLKGLSYEDVKIAPFRLPDSKSINFMGGRLPSGLENYLLGRFRAKPVFDHETCIGCGHCERNCPPKIISMSSGKPVPDLKKCIACFCCHEVCPVNSVKIRKHIIGRILFR